MIKIDCVYCTPCWLYEIRFTFMCVFCKHWKYCNLFFLHGWFSLATLQRQVHISVMTQHEWMHVCVRSYPKQTKIRGKKEQQTEGAEYSV